MLRHDSGLAQYRHEVGIPLPPRHDVPMEMIFDSGPGALTKVHAEIDPARPENFMDDLDRAAQGLIQIGKVFGRQMREVFFVPFGRKQQMAVVVRIFIEHHDRMGCMRQDQTGFWVTVSELGAENTTVLLGAIFDVGHAPRSPELLHSSSPISDGSKGLPSTRRRSSLPTLKKGTFLA